MDDNSAVRGIMRRSVESLHFILAQSGNSIIAAACPLKSSWKEHN